MQSLINSLKSLHRRRQIPTISNLRHLNPCIIDSPINSTHGHLLHTTSNQGRQAWAVDGIDMGKVSFLRRSVGDFPRRCIATDAVDDGGSGKEDGLGSEGGVAPRIKFKRLDKTARHIMQILNKEAVEEVKAQREVADIRPGYIVQLKVEVPENKRRITTIKGIVIARRNSGISTTFRLRRMVAGVGVESLFPLYSPNIKEIKVLDKKKVRRAKLYYLRDKMNALKK